MHHHTSTTPLSHISQWHWNRSRVLLCLLAILEFPILTNRLSACLLTLLSRSICRHVVGNSIIRCWFTTDRVAYYFYHHIALPTTAHRPWASVLYFVQIPDMIQEQLDYKGSRVVGSTGQSSSSGEIVHPPTWSFNDTGSLYTFDTTIAIVLACWPDIFFGVACMAYCEEKVALFN